MLSNQLQVQANAQLTDWRQYMLGLINDVRRQNSLSPVVLGNNVAAQQHAEAMLRGNFASHWGMDGFTPPMRYTLAGGYNYMSENVSNSILDQGVNYRFRTAKARILQSHQGLLESSAHRENILAQWHKKVNLGIACDWHACSIAQNFEGDYVEFTEQPTIVKGNLTFAGELEGGFTFEGVDVWYSQPPHSLTLAQLDATYSYPVGQEPAAFLREPAPPGSSYTSHSTRYRWESGTDPYRVEPSRERSRLSSRDTVVKSKTVPWKTVQIWKTRRQSFRIKADLSAVIDDLGLGVYTVLIWGINGVEKKPLTNYSIWVE